MPDINYTDERGWYHSTDDDYDDYDDGGYDNEWYEDVYYDDILTPVQKVKRGLHIWSQRLIHHIKWIASKHYRDHYDDIPF